MYPLFFTTIFLMIMALFSSSEMAHFQMNSLQNKLYAGLLSANHAKEEERTLKQFEKGNQGSSSKTKKEGEGEGEGGDDEEEEESSEPHARSLSFMFSRPPNNGKLNFYHLIHESQVAGLPPKFSFYETAAQLIRELYGKEHFFQKMERIEYRLLDSLLAMKDESKGFTYPEELASLEFEDREVQTLFHQMLRGGTLPHLIPSLLDHITFDKEGTKVDRKINFLFASEPLLQAIFKNKQLTDDLLRERSQLWEKIKKQEDDRLNLLQRDAMGRRDVSQKARHIVEKTLERYGVKFEEYRTLFDYTLGKKGTIFYAEDPLTHSITRQKL